MPPLSLMRSHTIACLTVLCLAACHPRSEGAAEPGNPAPVAAPAVGTTNAPRGRPGQKTGGLPEPNRQLPGRADEAPLVRIEDALQVDSLLGRRVRVAGHCTAAGFGRRAGSWTMEDAGSSIEVRGLVPPSCAARSMEQLTIFAQIEPTSSDSKERLLLRLPD
jgi:hypothetical protein